MRTKGLPPSGTRQIPRETLRLRTVPAVTIAMGTVGERAFFGESWRVRPLLAALAEIL